MDVDKNGCEKNGFEKEWMWIRMDVKKNGCEKEWMWITMDVKKNGCG